MGKPPFWELKKFSIDKYLKAVLQEKNGRIFIEVIEQQ